MSTVKTDLRHRRFRPPSSFRKPEAHVELVYLSPSLPSKTPLHVCALVTRVALADGLTSPPGCLRGSVRILEASVGCSVSPSLPRFDPFLGWCLKFHTPRVTLAFVYSSIDLGVYNARVSNRATNLTESAKERQRATWPLMIPAIESPSIFLAVQPRGSLLEGWPDPFSGNRQRSTKEQGDYCTQNTARKKLKSEWR